MTVSFTVTAVIVPAIVSPDPGNDGSKNGDRDHRGSSRQGCH